MTKATLTGGLKTSSAKPDDAPSPAAAQTAADGAGTGGTGGKADNASDDKSGDSDSDPEASSGTGTDNDKPTGGGTGAETTTAPAATGGTKSLADYRSAFGHEQGSVYFADGVDFTGACVSHIAVQGKAIADLQAENTQLKSTNKTLVKEVGGVADPIVTGSGDGTAKTGTGSKVDEYANVLESKLEKLKL
jgi:hypothetical protein